MTGLLIRVCPKGHRSLFRDCPSCAAEKRPVRNVAQRAQAVMDKMEGAREGRREKKRLTGIALAQAQRRAIDAWEVGSFPVGLA